MPRRQSVILAVLTVVIMLFPHMGYAQSDNSTIRRAVLAYFTDFQSETSIGKLKVSKTEINRSGKRIDIHVSREFSALPFRDNLIDSIYTTLREKLPSDTRNWAIRIYTENNRIEDLVPAWASDRRDGTTGTIHMGKPWVRNDSREYVPSKGLEGIHMAVTPSHGLYFTAKDTTWRWQRPTLYTTCEDLLTQSFTNPYLIPMLENAGAVVWSSRERDWQTSSVTVKAGQDDAFIKYGNWEKKITKSGYSPELGRIVPDSAQITTYTAVCSQGPGSVTSTSMFVPDIPQDGWYAVYVTYQSDSTSVDDARYIVLHTGGSTVFRVNQQIGGGTWLYLGTFHFRKGRSPEGLVSVDNSSAMQGTVSADAVRFGGGISVMSRPGAEGVEMPRYNMGAKYYSQYAGAPDTIYNKYNGTDEYREDIWARPFMTNWLSGGSVFNTSEKGMAVPLELSFALHTDAGLRTAPDTLIGTLAICTTDPSEGNLGNGESRLTNRDLADMVLTGVQQDLSSVTGRDWTYRGIWDRDYCESREPHIPSMLMELLSHQNWADTRYALDPNFRFATSRAIYKSLLRYVSYRHSRPYVVQPLPVSHFRIKSASGLHLEWDPTPDPLEPTATPKGYMVYVSKDGRGFDNGTFVTEPAFTLKPDKDVIYAFQVTAVNEGGESFPSQTLTACIRSRSRGLVLLLDGFQRLSGPQAFDNDSTRGFDLKSDPGVQYMKSPIHSGYQEIIDKASIYKAEAISLGVSDNSWEGRIISGNTLDFTLTHGKSVASAGYSFVSVSRESVQDGQVDLSAYHVVDLILGLQKKSQNDSIWGKDYSVLPVSLQDKLTAFLANGGALLASGTYCCSDASQTRQGNIFLQAQLHCTDSGLAETDADSGLVRGKLGRFRIHTEPDENMYGLPCIGTIRPGNGAFVLLRDEAGRNVAVGFNGGRKGSSVTMGIPFESIEGDEDRDELMENILHFLAR